MQHGELDSIRNTGRRRRQGMCLTAMAITCLTIGCGKSENRVAVYPVRGQVTFEGRPTPGAFVVLHPQTAAGEVPPARALVGKDGSFTVSTYTNSDGAPAGEYVATVEWPRLVPNGEGFEPGPNILPPRYSKPSTSDLRIRVAADTSNLASLQLRR